MEPTQNIVFHHQMPAQLRFSDVDHFGHVNNSVYFSLFDMCKTRYFLDVVGEKVFDELAIVLANVNANFLAPIYYPDEIVIETSCLGFGHKSFTIFQRAMNVRTREVKCECKSIMCTFDKKNKCSVAVPEEIRRKIMEFESK